jgi:integrase
MLTHKAIENARPGRYRDGRNLYLDVSPDGRSRRFVFRFTSPQTGKPTAAGLGTFPDVSLADARAKADEMRALIQRGIDPIAQKREQRAATLAEQKAATPFNIALAAYGKAFAAKSTTAETVALLKRHVPSLLPRPLAAISPSEILMTLAPIQARLPKTAARVRRAIDQTYAYARAIGLHDGANPADRSVFKFLMPPPPASQHFRAMDYRGIPDFWRRLCERPSARVLALRLLILAGLRTREALYLPWAEVDLDQRLITIPAARMKTRKTHVVPITDAMLSVLNQAGEQFGRRVYVFPNSHGGKFPPRALEALLHRTLYVEVSAHGFRSTLRDWLGDCTNVDRDTAEQILAHAIPGVEGAYRRSTGLEKRRQALALWGDYVTGQQESNVVSFAALARP